VSTASAATTVSVAISVKYKMGAVRVPALVVTDRIVNVTKRTVSVLKLRNAAQRNAAVVSLLKKT